MSEENVPWTLKGISEEARLAARRAAEQSGQTLGQWLNEAIRATDIEEQWQIPAQGGNPPAGDAVLTALKRLEQRVDDLERKLEKVVTDGSRGPESR